MVATDDQLERWKMKYGENFLNDLQAVRSGKISMQELATKMKVTKETIRFYFHRYFSETDLIGTRYFKRVPNKCQSADHVGNSVSTSLPNKRQSKIEQELTEIREMLEELLPVPNKRQSADSTKRDTYRLSPNNRQSEFNALME